MANQHALLSASSADRWITCPPSARLEEQVEEEQNQYAAEGTFAHELAELYLSLHLEQIKKATFTKKHKKLQSNEFYSQELENYVKSYVDFCIEKINESRAKTRDAVVLLEMRLDYSIWAREGFGTGDLVIVSDNELTVIDLKYGMGVPVSAEDNAQMKLYALGALNQFDVLYDIQNIKMVIHQPRLDNISISEMSTDSLLCWGNNTVMGAAEKAFNGEGDFRSGDHCRFCKVRFTCRARAEKNLELAQMDFRDPPLLSDDEIVEVLAAADELQRWASDVQSYALDQAVNHGKEWPGWKLVEGRSVRKYTDEQEAIKTLLKAGYEEDQLYKKEILGITAMEKLLGKKQFNTLLADHVEKPPGKPKLAPDSDKRPAVKDSAELDFKN